MVIAERNTKQEFDVGFQHLLKLSIHEKKCSCIKGPFTQNVSFGVSVSGRMGAVPIHYTALVLLLMSMLMLCVNGPINIQ